MIKIPKKILSTNHKLINKNNARVAKNQSKDIFVIIYFVKNHAQNKFPNKKSEIFIKRKWKIFMILINKKLMMMYKKRIRNKQ